MDKLDTLNYPNGNLENNLNKQIINKELLSLKNSDKNNSIYSNIINNINYLNEIGVNKSKLINDKYALKLNKLFWSYLSKNILNKYHYNIDVDTSYKINKPYVFLTAGNVIINKNDTSYETVSEVMMSPKVFLPKYQEYQTNINMSNPFIMKIQFFNIYSNGSVKELNL